MNEFGRIFIILGSVILLLGILLVVFDRIPFVGKLPGDILVKRGNFTFYFPIATSILLSIVLTLLFNFFLRK